MYLEAFGLSEFNDPEAIAQTEAAAALDELVTKTNTLEKTAFQNLSDATLTSLRKRGRQIDDGQFEQARQAWFLSQEKPVILGNIMKKNRDDRPKFEASLEKSRNAAAVALKKAGFAPEDHPRFADNPAAIRHQFAFRVSEAEPVRRALAALAAHDSEHAAALELWRACPDLAKKAQIDLEAAAARILGIRQPKPQPTQHIVRSQPLSV